MAKTTLRGAAPSDTHRALRTLSLAPAPRGAHGSARRNHRGRQRQPPPAAHPAPPWRPPSARLRLQVRRDALRKELAQDGGDLRRLAVDEVGEQRVKGGQVLAELRPRKGEQALQQRHDVRRHLGQRGGAELARGPVGAPDGPLAQPQVVAQHVQAKGDEAVFCGGGDQLHVPCRAERRRRRAPLGRAGLRRGLELVVQREEDLEVVRHRLEPQVHRLTELGRRRRRLSVERRLQRARRLVVHRVHAVEQPLHVSQLHRRVHRLQQLVHG
mmetsp:Transcript_13304/g.40161  ORF Transcript_13304/g.40161 Transcript_13304/m.40161 type:complete len:270 (-) Transcript_13304:706-1515(-)